MNTRRRRPKAGLSPVTAFWAGILLLLLPMVFLRLPERALSPVPSPTLPPQATAILNALPAQLSPARQALVETACSLVGRVDYFWGGKSTALGWNERWGTPAEVTAAGCDDTGKTMPLGLDCSGFISWAVVNALGDPAAATSTGDGVRDQYAHCKALAWTELQPGDLVFFPDLSHIGIMAGWTEAGTASVIHCSRSLGGVVVTADGAQAGFQLAGRLEGLFP